MSARPAALRPFQQLPFAELPQAPRLPHPFFEVPKREVIVRDAHFGEVRTVCRVLGEGPPLLLIHGLMTTSYSWRYVIAPLSRRYTVYAPDLVGSGDADKPDVAYTPEASAAWIGALIGALGLERPRVIGNSMGGYLCMTLGLAQPEVMGRLVNLHSPGAPLWRLHALRTALSLPGSAGILSWMVGLDVERWVQRNVHYFDERLKSREETAEYARPLRTPEGVNAFRRILKETLDPGPMAGFLDRLEGGFPVPLQLVYAKQDPMVPPVVGERIAARIPGAEIVWLERASHFAHVDATEAFLGAVEGFLAGG